MPHCPTCATSLRTIRQRDGLVYVCDRCSGRAVGIQQIRRFAGDRFSTQLLHQINSADETTARGCPFCSGKMRRLLCVDPPLSLVGCRSCRIVWFEPNQFEAIPEGALVSQDELEALAVELLEKDRVKRKAVEAGQSVLPDAGWKALPAMIGLPVELNTEPLPGRPWATWSLTALIVIISLIAFRNVQSAANQFGFIGAKAWRYGGFTFISSFFLHGGWLHLISNMYFLVVFGKRVENFLGWWRSLLLVFLSTLGGDLLHLLAQSHSTVPCVGASGGISGVIVFYALSFPKTRLGMMMWFRWVAIPVWIALLFWLLFQFILAYLQTQGIGNIGALAHLGGALTGFCCWLYWSKRLKSPESA